MTKTGTSLRPRVIQPVGTSTAGFVGQAPKGPVGKASLISSFAEFERIYGGLDALKLKGLKRSKHNDPKTVNYLAHSVHAFFSNGGSRLFVSRADSDQCEPTAIAFAAALKSLESVDEVAMIAAPGYSIFDQNGAIMQELVNHVEKPRAYRVAVLEIPPAVKDPKTVRAKINSSYAAFYHPWLYGLTPGKPKTSKKDTKLLLPPSGFVCGIYARNDFERGVFKAPANLPVLGAVGPERTISAAEQRTLTELGINLFRVFPGKGTVLWGARTATSDPEWKYINLRRYFAYLEHSIDRGTQWAVFENNGEALWSAVRRTIEDFLVNEWQNGALVGSKPNEAFFVRCDRTTMTQNDLDNGRLICLVGVAAIKPAEFVIIRITQQTIRPKPPR
ncbi:MAG TPA: phage tail sheath subtilisin-like domain-containing protein [Candidatus Angelobacter sp.]|nr:phage tail sheath subtilisin-like domain-containing protein [Candidatus Angelobacter sp.]